MTEPKIIFKIRDKETGKFLCDGHKNMRDAYLDNRGAIFYYEKEAIKYLSEYKYDRLRFEHRTRYDLEIAEYRIDQIETRTITEIPSMEISAAIGRKYRNPKFSDLVSHCKRAELDGYTLNHIFLLKRDLTTEERAELAEIGMYSPQYPFRRVIIVDNERSALLGGDYIKFELDLSTGTLVGFIPVSDADAMISLGEDAEDAEEEDEEDFRWREL